MFTYVVLHHPAHGYKSIRKTHAPLGFLFSVFWLLYKRIWGRGLLFLLIAIIFPPLWEESVGQGGSLLAPGAIALYTGFRGNMWYQEKLESQGYEVVMEVEAKSASQALANAMKDKEGKNDG